MEQEIEYYKAGAPQTHVLLKFDRTSLERRDVRNFKDKYFMKKYSNGSFKTFLF